MEIKYTKTTLSKLEQLFEETGYLIRFEKGQFHSGYCILESKKIAVINKFLDVEGRINAMLDILTNIDFKGVELSEEMQKFIQTIPSMESKGQDETQMEIDFDN